MNLLREWRARFADLVIAWLIGNTGVPVKAHPDERRRD